MKYLKALIIFVVSIYAGIGTFSAAKENPMKEVDPALSFSRFYNPVPVSFKPSIPAYALPVQPADVAQWREIFDIKLPYLKAAEPLVRHQGFGAVPGTGDDFVEILKNLKDRDVPVFISTDVMLHLYHVQFDETLRTLEERYFTDDLLYMLNAMKHYIEPKKVSGSPCKAGKELAVRYLMLASALLDPESQMDLPPDVLKELHLIAEHSGFEKSPLFTYLEDYSQYVPRGHYTRSPRLKRYFTAMMYLGRMTFLLFGGEPHGRFDEPFLISETEASRQTYAALLLEESLRNADMPSGERCLDAWHRIYSVTSFFSGTADDLGPEDYKKALTLSGGKPIENVITDKAVLARFKEAVLSMKPAAIYSGTGNVGTADPATTSGKPAPEILEMNLRKLTGFRLMGQRFIPDSYFMGRLVFPTIGGPPREGRPFTSEMTPQGLRKVWPRGLDVMALLGFKTADEWLNRLGDSKYDGYASERARLLQELNALSPDDWHRNAYWAWLHVLSLLAEKPAAGYQTFQLQPAWADKCLNTALGSWTQLRHDTILYAKQSYTMLAKSAMRPPQKPVPGYVEPAPNLYAELLALTRMTHNTLKDMGLIDKASDDRFGKLEEILRNTLDIAIRELENKPLSETDVRFIKNLAVTLETFVKGPSDQPVPGERFPAVQDEVEMRVTMAADVHTDANTKQVLEEALGTLDMLVICARVPDGRLRLFVGPAFSHYEFKLPMSQRLTDESWRKRLERGDVPDRGEWVSRYVSERAGQHGSK